MAVARRCAKPARLDGRVLAGARRPVGPRGAHQASAGRDRRAPERADQPHAVHADHRDGARAAYQHHRGSVRDERGRRAPRGKQARFLGDGAAGGELYRAGRLVGVAPASVGMTGGALAAPRLECVPSTREWQMPSVKSTHRRPGSMWHQATLH
ncbi:hypothetical protein BCAR13_760090 [Paraburkholderia caribensis]|nr:hypothetical protein BCAR13_760090 [Paraburkholderia caribensis]